MSEIALFAFLIFGTTHIVSVLRFIVEGPGGLFHRGLQRPIVGKRLSSVDSGLPRMDGPYVRTLFGIWFLLLLALASSEAGHTSNHEGPSKPRVDLPPQPLLTMDQRTHTI